MKRLKNRSRLSKLHSFTLVELLVVMAIIAILVGVLGVSVGAALNAAKRAKAQVTANSIQTGVLGYYTEYGIYPVPANTTTDYVIGDSDAANWSSLIYALSGNVNPYNPTITTAPGGSPIANTRAISFLNLKNSDVDKANNSNAPLNPLPTGTQIYFNIAIDSDYDGLLGTTAPSSGSVNSHPAMPNFAAGTPKAAGGTSTAGVAVWSNCNAQTTSTNANFYIHTY